MKYQSKSLGEATSALPDWQYNSLGILLCAVATYFLTNIVLVFMGQATASLYDPIGIGITCLCLMVCGLLGVLVKRPFIVGALFACAGVAFLLQFALRSTGNPLGWIRQGVFYLMPLLNGLLLGRWSRTRRLLDRSSSHD